MRKTFLYYFFMILYLEFVFHLACFKSIDIFQILLLLFSGVIFSVIFTFLSSITKKEKLNTVLYTLSETVRICTVALQAFLVETPKKIFEKFGYSENLQTFASIEKFSLENHGMKVDKGQNLFPRLDVKSEIEFLDTPNAPAQKTEPAPAAKG